MFATLLSFVLSVPSLPSATGTLLASALSLTSTNEYFWTTGAAPYRIIGQGAGSSKTNLVNRGEDVAFLWECAREREHVVMDSTPIVSSEAYSSSYTNNYQRSFPTAVTDTDFRRLFYTRWGENPCMRTNGLYCSFAYVPSKLVTSIVHAGTGTVSRVEAMTNMFVNGEIPCVRTATYEKSLGHRVIRAGEFFDLYTDFHTNNAAAFEHNLRGKSVSRQLDESNSYHAGDYYSNGGEGAWSDPVTRSSSYVTITTNGTAQSVFQPSYTVSEHYSKYKTTGWNGQIPEGGTQNGFEYLSPEYWSNPKDSAYIKFHPFMSDMLEEVRTFGLFRLTHRFRYNTGGTFSSPTTNIVTRDVLVLKPLQSTRMEPDDDEGPRFAIDVEMPKDADDVVRFVGEEYPAGKIQGMVPEPDNPKPLQYISSGRYATSSNTTGSEILSVTLSAIVGVAKIKYRAREIKE